MDSLHKLQVEPYNTRARTNKYSSRKILPYSYSSSFLSPREKKNKQMWEIANNVSQFARNEGSAMNSVHNLEISCGEHTRIRIIQHISHEQKWANRLSVYSWWRQRSLQIEKDRKSQTTLREIRPNYAGNGSKRRRADERGNVHLWDPHESSGLLLPSRIETNEVLPVPTKHEVWSRKVARDFRI